MVTCSICGKTLTDPISVLRGIGPECIMNVKNDAAGQGNMFTMRARYTYGFLDNVLYLEDGLGDKSLTNDMENALDEIWETVGGLQEYRIMYKDSFGQWDGVDISSKRVQFFSIGETDFDKAIKKLHKHYAR